MSLSVPSKVLVLTTEASLELDRDRAARWSSHDVDLSYDDLTTENLAGLANAAEKAGDKSFSRVIGAIQAARGGDTEKSIPRLTAAPAMVTAFLRKNLIDGWLYHKARDGNVYPSLVVSVGIVPARNNEGTDILSIDLLSTNGRGALGSHRHSISLAPEDVTRKKVGVMLANQGYLKETPALKKQYLTEIEAYREELTTGFAGVYRYSGDPLGWRVEARENRKVVHDIGPKDIPSFNEWAPSKIMPPVQEGQDPEAGGTGAVPIHPMLRVFDLHTHEFFWANNNDLTRYAYNKSLREKLILPADQRELLDILTTDISTFTSDIIEGKSAGNVIMAKGVPGVGKTLTAEVYSELIERPLYSIHSGSLGTNAAEIRKNLEEVFKRAARWDAVLLLDEADVFVIERGTNIEQNAIVAEFLRTLEYFSGLLFMTTNRANHIDEAIISRCAAIIDYKVPGRDDARRIWQVMATNYGAELSDEVLEGLLDGFPTIAPRDIKMLLRLALRVAAHKDEDLSVDVFRRCAMFRGLHLLSTDEQKADASG